MAVRLSEAPPKLWAADVTHMCPVGWRDFISRGQRLLYRFKAVVEYTKIFFSAHHRLFYNSNVDNCVLEKVEFVFSCLILQLQRHYLMHFVCLII